MVEERQVVKPSELVFLTLSLVTRCFASHTESCFTIRCPEEGECKDVTKTSNGHMLFCILPNIYLSEAHDVRCCAADGGGVQ